MRIAIGILLTASSFGTDLIFVNGNVITVDSSKPAAEAFALANGRFLAVGSNAAIRRLATPETKIIDLKSATVTPGFNDVHLHPHASYAEDSPYYNPWLGPDKVHNMDELVAALKRKAAVTPLGQLIRGERYDDGKLGRHPTKHDLDLASTGHPISICNASGHAVVNSRCCAWPVLQTTRPVPAREIKDIVIESTWIGGKAGYTAEK
jgi:predicted amidohydrolase YtcJ